MKKSIKLAIITYGLLMGFTGAWSQQASASKIPSNYSFDGSKFTGPIPYYSITRSKKAYIWNNPHTKRVHNLKNYPNTIWMVSKAYVKQVKGKNEVYYQVASAYNPKVKGTVWSGYLTKNTQKMATLFNDNASYISYIDTNRASKLNSMVNKLFPNSGIDVNLAKYSYTRSKKYSNHFTNLKVITFNPDDRYERMAPSIAIKYIEQDLNNMGYTGDVRKSMSDYKIAADFVGNAEAIDNTKALKLSKQYTFPVNLPNFVDMIDYQSRAIVIGIPK
ncbi:hypothetical protein PL11_007490 [Lentilactobacillus curieae]|uniref:D-alanyl-D-alanine carboxypeptidase n=1 Tax=Lentilactobacillus curieae TaxID=1138822 RepID=A0A1S6QJI3_9LACO|nr:hypothetical protein [Lentilactobacillus curieae]AQW21765.1 hypothetical protein PL11_007490 [Lentilactobacillus curieae]